MGNLVFYQIPISHFCEKIRWALDYKRISYTPVCVSPFTRRELREVSESLQVPIIRDGDRVVCDSSAIVEYLDEICPEPALIPPKEPERAECLEIERIADEEIAPAVRRLAYGALMKDSKAFSRLFPKKGAAARILSPFRRRWAARKLKSHFGITNERLATDRLILTHALSRLQGRLDGRTHFVGESLTIADIAVASLVQPIEQVEEVRESPEVAILLAWVRRIRSDHGRRAWTR